MSHNIPLERQRLLQQQQLPAPTGNAPLAGLKVIAVEQFGAGPYGSLYLADMGADIIKVEDISAGGDVGRTVPPFTGTQTSLYFEAFNRGKRSISLDLKSVAGQEVLRRLVASADAVYSNLRGDIPKTLGLTYGQLSKINPKLVCVALTGYGRTGDKARLPAYDALIQAEAGWAAVTGSPADPPTKTGLSLADYIGGITAALGLLARVLQARETGVGGDVDVDLYRSALSMYAYQGTWTITAAHDAPRQEMSAHPSIAPFQFFVTADGHIAVACAKEKFFVDLCELLGMPELSSKDNKFGGFAQRLANKPELLSILAETFSSKPTSHWVKLLTGVVPVAPVRSHLEALDPEELAELGILARYETQEFGTIGSVGLPIQLSGYVPEYRPAPALGEHLQEVLAEAGISPEDITAYRAAGAFGPTPLS